METVDLCSSLRSAFELRLEKSSEIIVDDLDAPQYSRQQVRIQSPKFCCRIAVEPLYVDT